LFNVFYCDIIVLRGDTIMKKGEKRPDLQRARIGKCIVCGKEFRAVKDFIGKDGYNRKQKYCSKECWSKRGKEEYRNRCEYCGKVFVSYGKAVRKYCSRECSFKDKVGVKAGNYKDGKSLEREKARLGYQLAKWRKEVYKRDNYTCQNCGSKRHLNAHHILSWADNKEKRFIISNGVTLCEECHGKIHGKNFANRRIKKCKLCGVKILNQTGSELCRSCAIKKSWIKRKEYTNKKAVILNDRNIKA